MSSPNRNELLVTGDKSHTLVSERFGVPYHSVHGAVEESRHVFLQQGVLPVLEMGVSELKILEMGMGTGLNALLMRELAQRHPEVRFEYLTYEKYPISEREVAALNYPQLLGLPASWFAELHGDTWGTSVQLAENFHFTKVREDFIDAAQRPYEAATVDVIFYDAFAPVSQPEFWSGKALEVSFAALRDKGLLVTYCAKGQFKRDLKATGFTVEPRPGPPGKREMTRAWK